MIVAPHALLLLSAAPPPQQIMRHTSVMPIMAEFSRNTELRSEVENPFAKFRLFLFPAAFAGAAIATYFGGTGLLAEMAGLRPSTGLPRATLGQPRSRKQLFKTSSQLNNYFFGTFLASSTWPRDTVHMQ